MLASQYPKNWLFDAAFRQRRALPRPLPRGGVGAAAYASLQLGTAGTLTADLTVV